MKKRKVLSSVLWQDVCDALDSADETERSFKHHIERKHLKCTMRDNFSVSVSGYIDEIIPLSIYLVSLLNSIFFVLSTNIHCLS